MKMKNNITNQQVLYSIENWILQTKHASMLNVMEVKHLRRVVGNTKLNGERNKKIREDTKQLSSYGHILRMYPNWITKKISEKGRLGKKRIDRPRKTWSSGGGWKEERQKDKLDEEDGYDRNERKKSVMEDRESDAWKYMRIRINEG